MKRVLMLTLILAIMTVIFSGCGRDNGDSPLLVPRKDGVIKVTARSSPEGYYYSFREDDAYAIVDYLSELNLISDFEEDPHEYVGMTWIISVEYDNGDVATVYHFGNMFIRTDSGPWYKMTYEEASRIDKLIKQTE